MDSQKEKKASRPLVEGKMKSTNSTGMPLLQLSWEEKPTMKGEIKYVNFKKWFLIHRWRWREWRDWLWTLRQWQSRDMSVLWFKKKLTKLIWVQTSSSPTNTVNLLLAERLQVGGFSFGSDDFSFENIFILTAHGWIKSLFERGFHCCPLLVVFKVKQSENVSPKSRLHVSS